LLELPEESLPFEYVSRRERLTARSTPPKYRNCLAWLTAILLLLPAACAQAHSFGTPYNLPVPFWMYAYGASATLAVSFAIVAYFAGVPIDSDRLAGTRAGAGLRIPGAPIAALRTLSVALLALCVATGLFGTKNVYANFNMTFFWLVFALGLLYVTALIGDVYALLNPWRVLCDAFVAVTGRRRASIGAYPASLAYYPALFLYAAFIWIELFGQSQPFSLAITLIVYTLVNCVGAALFGRDAWFRYGEFFAVMFRLVGLMAPVAYAREADGTYAVVYRKPLLGLLQRPAEHPSLLLFVLFMLSSTAFDGLHETLPWVTVFWKNIFPILTAGSTQPYTVTVNYYYYLQWAMLLVSPIVYLAVYLAFIVVSKMAAGSRQSVRTLALAFTLSLVPIAFVYNVTHYFTLLASQGLQIVRLASDPFGLQWNLFGTATLPPDPLILDAGTVWHTQVALILIGHILGVYVSHIEALRVFRGTKRAIVSQLPMLILMIIFTTVGLWILSLPIAGGQVLVPPPS
jgi:hypothetical protein